MQWHTGGGGGGGAAVGTLERGEAAGERRLQLGGQEDAQLGDDAARDELVRGHVKRRVPHLHACRGARGQRSNAAVGAGSSGRMLTAIRWSVLVTFVMTI